MVILGYRIPHDMRLASQDYLCMISFTAMQYLSGIMFKKYNQKTRQMQVSIWGRGSKMRSSEVGQAMGAVGDV